LRKLEILKSDLEARHDFSIYAAYRVIDRYNEGAINTFNLSSFLKNNGYYATEKELLCIIRRIDTDGDAKISYIEFADFMRSTEPRALIEDLKSRSYSAERSSGSNLRQSYYGSPLKSSANF